MSKQRSTTPTASRPSAPSPCLSLPMAFKNGSGTVEWVGGWNVPEPQGLRRYFLFGASNITGVNSRRRRSCRPSKIYRPTYNVGYIVSSMRPHNDCIGQAPAGTLRWKGRCCSERPTMAPGSTLCCRCWAPLLTISQRPAHLRLGRTWLQARSFVKSFFASLDTGGIWPLRTVCRTRRKCHWADTPIVVLKKGPLFFGDTNAMPVCPHWCLREVGPRSSPHFGLDFSTTIPAYRLG